jgi:acyl-CoA dehydrogenase
MTSLSIPWSTSDAVCENLRREVRAFLAENVASLPARKKAESWTAFNPEFSRALGHRGWIGMVWPTEYGGHGRSALERYVVLEELLAAGAPCGAHWIADRQSGPLLLRYGTEEQKRALLPRMARGEVYFCIGMSEPDAGSDVASLRTRAERTEHGWKINGTKLWTTIAHRADYMIVLLRTDPQGKRHEGLSQLLVDLKTPGITIRPIRNLAGETDFNEVVFEDALVPHDALLGAEGHGWEQVTAELALERSGPERYLSSMQLMVAMTDAADPGDLAQVEAIGRLTAEFATLRAMSSGVAGMLARGERPNVVAAIVKALGNDLEQKLPQVAHDLFGEDAYAAHPDLAAVAGYLTQVAPSFSLRGGTREILRGIIARELGLR